MRATLIWLTGFILVAMLSGCVSKARYNDLGDDYRMAGEQLIACQAKVGKLDDALLESEQAGVRCREKATLLESEMIRLRHENDLLSQRIDSLSQTVQNNETVISLQGAVIRLFDDERQTLQNSLREQLAAQGIEADAPVAPPKKVILVNRLLFRTGSAELSAEGKALLRRLSGLLKDDHYDHIRVQGHTDSRPMQSTARYTSNWDLSVARAASTVRFLQNTVGISPERLSATGFGPYAPIASNDTPEGQHQNRRIEIILEAR